MQIKEYLDNFKIQPPKSKEDIMTILSNYHPTKIAKANVREFIYEMDRRNRKNVDDDKIYKIINKDLFTSVVLTGCTNYDRLIKMGEHVENLEFGSKVVDLGCMNGLFTCFLAINNPEARFTGVDSSLEAITIAKELADYLKLDNVEFIDKNIFDIDGRYDNVFSSYLIHELLTAKQLERKLGSSSEAISIIEEGLAKFTNKASSLLKDGGKSYHFERLFLGYEEKGVLNSFANNGLNIETTECIKVENETDNIVFIETIKTEDITCDTDELFREVMRELGYPKTPDIYQMDAKIRLMSEGDEVINGYYLYKDNELKGKALLCNSVVDNTAILLYMETTNEIQCYNYDVSEREMLIKEMQTMIENEKWDTKPLSEI